jgi:hypothetical protein
VYILAGIPMAIIRITEPYVWSHLKKDLRKVGCFKTKKDADKKKKYSTESLATFINSAMNIEFVYIILLGIN